MRIRASLLIVATLQVGAPLPAFAAFGLHQYAHSSWRLPDSVVKGYPRALTQTQDGYLWLGTEFGLFRFDGVKFTAWSPPSGSPLPNGAITKLLSSHDGSLWIGTATGLARWKDGRLSRFDGLEGQYVAALAEDRQGAVWVGTSAGLVGTANLCTLRRGQVSCASADGAFGRFVTALFEDKEGRLWVGAATGLWQWTPNPSRVLPPNRFNMEVHSIRGDSSGGILVAFNREIRRVSNGTLVQHYAESSTDRPLKPVALLQDREGGTWVGTQDQGILRIHDGRVEQFTRADGLSGAFVTDLLTDREGNIWVATLTGLDRFREVSVATISWRDGLSGSVIASVLAGADGTVWFGTDAGLDLWKDGRISRQRMHARPEHDVLGSLLKDSRGRIWASSQRELMVIENGRARPIASVPGGYVHAIVEDARGDIWIADQERGLYQLRNERLVAVVPPEKLGGRTARSLAADPAGGLWVGFFQGGVAHLKDGRFHTYAVEDGLGRGDVSSLHFDHAGALWASTQGGLSRLSHGRIATISTINGLPCDSVHWSIEDDSGAMWVYTACGLVRITQPEITKWLGDSARAIFLTLHSDRDGVTGAAIGGSYGPKAAKSTDGRLWFATLDGVGVIDPRHVPFNSTPPPVHIVQVDLDRRLMDPSGMMRFPSPVRDLRIDYTALSLSAPEKVRFRYKLEGRDSTWLDAGNRRQAFYTDLAPRTYRFHVVASNNDDVWNESGATWEFSIMPAFYQTMFFRVWLTLAVLAVAWLSYRVRMRRLAARLNARFEERLDERTRIAQDLHDTLLQGFVSISMHLHLLADELAASPVRPKLDRIIERVRHAIDEGRVALSGLRDRPHPSEALEKALTRDGNDFRGDGSTVLRIVVEGKPRPLKPFIRDEVYRISREALANAFRHSQATQIDVTIEYAASRLGVQVCDNGRGLTSEQLDGPSGHWGLRGMRERANRIGASLQVLSRLNGGTEISLVVPGAVVFEAVGAESATAQTESSRASV